MYLIILYGGETIMKLWWTSTLAWLVLFAATAIFIAVREVDGSGLEQTSETRLAAFIVLGVAFVFIALCQVVFLYFARKKKSIATR